MPRCSPWKYARNSVERNALYCGMATVLSVFSINTKGSCVHVEENDSPHESYLHNVSIPFSRDIAGWFSNTHAKPFSLFPVLSQQSSFIGFTRNVREIIANLSNRYVFNIRDWIQSETSRSTEIPLWVKFLEKFYWREDFVIHQSFITRINQTNSRLTN